MKVYYRDISALPEKLLPYAYQFKIDDNVKKLLETSLDKNRILFDVSINGYTDVLGKLSEIKFSEDKILGKINGIKVIISYDTIKKISDINYEAIMNILSGYNIFRVTARKNYTRFGVKTEYHVTDIKPISVKTDKETAKELIKEHGVLSAFNEIMGWKTTDIINRLNFVRLFSVITGNHIIQITMPNTGKTYFSYRIKEALNYGYFTTAVSQARLIYNAQTRTMGEVFLRNGIIIDEVFSCSELRSMEESLLSGLENGLWTRGVSVDIELNIKKIPFLFFGNMPDKLINIENSRLILINKLISHLKMKNAVAFIDRIAVVDLIFEPVNISDNLLDYFYTNSVLRGYVELLKEEYHKTRKTIQEKDIDYEGYGTARLVKYYNDIRAFNQVVGEPYDDDYLKNMILGFTEFKNPDKQKQTVDLKNLIIDVIRDYGGQIDIQTLLTELSDYNDTEVRKSINELINREIIIQNGPKLSLN